MRCWQIGLLCSLALAGCNQQSKPAPESNAAGAQVLAEFPGPTFLENLYVAPDGAVYFTNYTGKAIERRLPNGSVAPFTILDSYPVSLAPMGLGFLAAVHATPFTQGNFAGSGRLLRIDHMGMVMEAFDAPEAGFLNGMAALPNGDVLVADSLKAQILRFDPKARTLTAWFSDPQLAPQTQPSFLPGANGLKLVGSDLIISSSARKALFRLPLTPDFQPAGPLQMLVDALPGADDFAPLPEGGYLLATHGDSILRIAPNGATSVLTNDPRIKGATAVALMGDGAARRAVILGTGGFSAGDSADAVVLSVPAPPQP